MKVIDSNNDGKSEVLLVDMDIHENILTKTNFAEPGENYLYEAKSFLDGLKKIITQKSS